MTINLAQTPVPSIQEQLDGSIEVKFSPGDFVMGDSNEPFQLDLKFWGVFSENIFHSGFELGFLRPFAKKTPTHWLLNLLI